MRGVCRILSNFILETALNSAPVCCWHLRWPSNVWSCWSWEIMAQGMEIRPVSSLMPSCFSFPSWRKGDPKGDAMHTEVLSKNSSHCGCADRPKTRVVMTCSDIGIKHNMQQSTMDYPSPGLVGKATFVSGWYIHTVTVTILGKLSGSPQLQSLFEFKPPKVKLWAAGR